MNTPVSYLIFALSLLLSSVFCQYYSMNGRMYPGMNLGGMRPYNQLYSGSYMQQLPYYQLRNYLSMMRYGMYGGQMGYPYQRQYGQFGQYGRNSNGNSNGHQQSDYSDY